MTPENQYRKEYLKNKAWKGMFLTKGGKRKMKIRIAKKKADQLNKAFRKSHDTFQYAQYLMHKTLDKKE